MLRQISKLLDVENKHRTNAWHIASEGCDTCAAPSRTDQADGAVYLPGPGRMGLMLAEKEEQIIIFVRLRVGMHNTIQNHYLFSAAHVVLLRH